ncbi:MAG: DUF192 domain-containing protein [Elusimicrobiales bacterium]|jgi:uncharacterized membrane protein (UPF0127 family)|nr:DUF192 domain-containing protein [Elusimicrobiales bacterium]HOL63496.1 DUF192 domain-containing protein [Elusimicrobiales bacterium]HPO95433.1 DUF192 domain-containing protein [Elusimicrobiales bacterium]
MIVYNKTKDITVSDKVRVADTFLSRFLGLIPKKQLSSDEGLLITKCNGIHTCFMSFDIDAVFVSKDFKVLDIITIKPWRFSKFYESEFVLEFNSNFVYGKISVGDFIELREKR